MELLQENGTLVILRREGMDAYSDGREFWVRLDSIHGRMAARAYAHSIAAEDPEVARTLLQLVGRTG